MRERRKVPDRLTAEELVAASRRLDPGRRASDEERLAYHDRLEAETGYDFLRVIFARAWLRAGKPEDCDWRMASALPGFGRMYAEHEAAAPGSS